MELRRKKTFSKVMNFSWRLTWPVKIHQSEQSGQTSFYRSKFKQLTSKLKTPEGQKTSSTKGKKDENTDQRVPVMTPVRPLSYLFIFCCNHSSSLLQFEVWHVSPLGFLPIPGAGQLLLVCSRPETPPTVKMD